MTWRGASNSILAGEDWPASRNVYSRLDFEINDEINEMTRHWLCEIGRVCMVLAMMCSCEAWCAQTAPRAVKAHSPAVAQWKTRVTSIQKTLEESDENCVGAPAAGIVDAFGVNGDALSVALVDFCTGGAYTDWVVAMRMDHGKPVTAKFRDANGKTVENGFASGASAMHRVDVKLVAAKKGIYNVFVENDSEGKPAQCGAKAYVWNAKSQTFDLNLRLSKTAGAEYCSSLRGR